VSAPGGLLLAMMDPPSDAEAEFNAWYNEEHAPNRLTVPGVLSARRYTAVWPDGPRYMAMYDLESPETVARPEYRRLYAEQSEREKAMFARIPRMDRRVLKTLHWMDPLSEHPRLVLTVGLQPRPGAESEVATWYGEEHIGMLCAVPGWQRIRLYEQVEGTGPHFVAVHEIESEAVFETDAYRAATSTPWRERIHTLLERRERSLFQLLRSFGR